MLYQNYLKRILFKILSLKIKSRFFNKRLKIYFNYLLSFFNLTISKESASDRWKMFFELLKNYEINIDTFVNVGFAYGSDHIFQNISPKKVVCIDPLPESLLHMKSFEKKYKKKNKNVDIKLFNIALGDKKSKGFISVHDEDLTGGTFLEQEVPSGTGNIKKFEVNIKPFDALGVKTEGISLLKIDAQGYELKILKGMQNTISKFEFIIVETRLIETLKSSGTFKDLFLLMSDYNFELLDILSLNRRPLDNATTEIDVAFCKKNNPIINQKRWSK